MTVAQADIILANSKFSARVTKSNFASLREIPKVVYPGVNIAAYELKTDLSDPDIMQITSYVVFAQLSTAFELMNDSDLPTLLSLNRFEKKKNVALAIESFGLLRHKLSNQHKMRLVIAGQCLQRMKSKWSFTTLNRRL